MAAKVDKNTHFEAGCFQIVENLSLFISRETIKCLEFNNDQVKTDQVCNVLLIEYLAFVPNLNWFLSIKWYSSRTQFDFHCFLIDRFQKPGAKVAMHFNSSTHDGIHFLF